MPAARTWAPVLRAAIAPFLLLVTPVVIYLHYQRYGFAHADVLILVALLAGAALLLGAVAARWPLFEIAALAGLITWFADVQMREPGLRSLALLFLLAFAVCWVLRRHAAHIVSLTTATVLLLSLLPAQGEARASSSRSQTTARDRPFLLHIVLDEHIGVEGLPADVLRASVGQELQEFYADRGFRLFGRAYSEYSQTLWSLSHLFNLAPGGYLPGLTVPGDEEYTHRLTRNTYFDRLIALGYKIRVYQPDYLDLCAAHDDSVATCHTYRTRSLDLLHRLNLSTAERIRRIAGTFVRRSEIYERGKQVYTRGRRHLIAAGVSLPAWNWERGNAASVGTMPVLETISADLAQARPGEAVLAHLLLPHYPYAFDADCRARPPNEWLIRSDDEHADVASGITNTRQSRAARYRLYAEQLACTQKKVDRLLAAIPSSVRDEAVIIIHGDHGSRIGVRDPKNKPGLTLASSDYADHFSTLFAIRSPHLPAQYDSRVTPITCLMRALVDTDFQSTEDIGACSSKRVVYFHGTSTPAPRDLPSFWVHPATGRAAQLTQLEGFSLSTPDKK